MIIEKTNYGKRVKVWNDGYSDDWTYEIRNVKVLNSTFERQHPIIEELAEREAKVERKLLLLLFSMENFFRAVYATESYELFDKWEDHNRMDFNEWYHHQTHALIDEIDGISSTYCYHATADGYGWCF